MENFLVLIHDVFTGNVVRQIVVKAENAAAAVASSLRFVDADVEHAIAIRTGSVAPEPAPEPEPEPEPEPVQEAELVIPDPSDLVIDELKSLPPEVLHAVVAKLTSLGG